MARMHRGATAFLLTALALTALAATVSAYEPLVDLESGRSLVSNIKAHRVGDIITILIVESTTANATSKTNANEKNEMSGGPGLGFLDVINVWGLDTENKYTGNGSTNRTGNLQSELTVRISEVLHNGDFVLAGNRMVEINGERQLIEISGVCRSRDIQPNNTILSTFIADARIAYNGNGPINSTSEPGLVTKLFNWLF